MKKENELTIENLMKAIKANCLDCYGRSWKECAKCDLLRCPFKPYHDMLDWNDRSKQATMKSDN